MDTLKSLRDENCSEIAGYISRDGLACGGAFPLDVLVTIHTLKSLRDRVCKGLAGLGRHAKSLCHEGCNAPADYE
jgi:hypothetical protein